ncbi:hypothetical protein [Erysipelothrix aquatica]|nr:hypothetical protein [Erysipelothrix aquatica]
MINAMISAAIASTAFQAILYPILFYAVFRWLKEVWADDEA